MNERCVTVVGGGPAGCRAALLAARRGARVTLYESGAIGGRCLAAGCMPVKALLHYARGCSSPPTAEQWREYCRNLRSRLELLSDSMTAQLRCAGVKVRRTHMSLEETDASDTVLVAVGCLSPVPPVVAGKRILLPEDLLSLPEVPESLAVLGAGPSGMELAQIFACLGADVTVYEQAERILPAFPPEGARALEGVCRERGIHFALGKAAEPSRLPQNTILLTAGGRTPAMPSPPDRRFIRIGDCGGRSSTAYEAELEAEAAVAALWGEPPHMSAHIPRCVCGIYDLVTVGGTGPLSAAAYSDGNGLAFLRDETSGYVRLHAGEDGTLRGAELLLPNGAELAALLAALLNAGTSARTLADAAFFHPAHTEIIRDAARELCEVL